MVTKSEQNNLLTTARRAHPAPRVLVLVGLPGSGKSTFAHQLESVGWARVSQDDLGSRQRCEAKTVEYLVNGRNVVIDRCNFNGNQRKNWVDYATVRGCQVGVVVFATPLQSCIERVEERTHHPTLQAKDGKRVVYEMAEGFVFPEQSEGFTFCRVVTEQVDFDRVLTELLETT